MQPNSGELVNITCGYAFKSQLFNELHGIPLVRIRDVASGQTSLRYDGPYDDRFLVRNGDLLVGMDGEFRVAEWSGGDALLNQRVCRIEPIEGRTDKTFLKYFLPRKLKEIEDRTPFVTVKHLSADDIRSVSFPPIDIKEQRRLGSLLDKANRLRQKRNQALALADDLVDAAFVDLFGDPINNPKHWPQLPLEKLGEVKGGLQVTFHRSQYSRSVPYLRVANVFRDRLDLTEVKQMNVTDSELERTRLLEGNVLMRRGTRQPE